jgi:hypothetical protein
LVSNHDLARSQMVDQHAPFFSQKEYSCIPSIHEKKVQIYFRVRIALIGLNFPVCRRLLWENCRQKRIICTTQVRPEKQKCFYRPNC